MKSLRILLGLCGCAALAGSSSLTAQTAGDPDMGFTVGLHPTIPDTYLLSWWGASDSTYFLYHSTNLKLWLNLPVMEIGTDAVMSYSFTAGTNDFFRVGRAFEAPADLNAADFDGDGLTNGYEMDTSHTNPMRTDTDGDDLSDAWEISHGTDPLTPVSPTLDTDSDGVPDIVEVKLGTDVATAGSEDTANLTQLKILSP